MNTLKSLALLKAYWDERHDYIDNFVPFVAECLRTAPIEVVALEVLQHAVAERFGITIPQGALKTILKRARHHGYVIVDPAERVFRAVPEKLVSLRFESLQAEVEGFYEAFLAGFMAFARRRYSLELDHGNAEGLFIGFLNRHALPILEGALSGLPIIAAPAPNAKQEYVLGEYVQEVQAAGGSAFRFLETVAKGHVLASVLLYPSIAEAARNFEGVEVYLDTALVLRALGYSHSALNAPCAELLALLDEVGAERRCFQHTLSEVENVLQSVHSLLRDPRRLQGGYGDVLQHFLDCNATASDVDLALALLPVRLRGVGITVVDTPVHSKELGLDERVLEQMLQNGVHYRTELPRVRDLNSLTAIHRLRKGTFPNRLEACRAIFVTTNHAFARVSSEYFKLERERGNVGAIVPHCILDDAFTALVWLKSPQRMPDLPLKKILAECYAAINPSTSLWRRYLEELDKFRERGAVSAEEYALLRFSGEARSLLMDRTLGEVEAFGEGTVQEVLRVARTNLQAEAHARAAAGEDRARKAEQALEDARQSAAEDQQARLGRVRVLAEGIAHYVSAGIAVVIALLLITGGGLLEPWSGHGARGGWFGTALGGAMWLAALFGLWSSFTGGSLMSLRRSARRTIANWVEKRVASWVG